MPLAQIQKEETQLVRRLPNLLDVVLVGVVFPPGFRADGVDDQVGMEVVTVRVSADQHLESGEFLCQLQGDLVGGFGGEYLLRGEGLDHVIVHSSAPFARMLRISSSAAAVLVSAVNPHSSSSAEIPS